MTESVGEIIGMHTYSDTVHLEIVLMPEDSKDLAQIWEWRIGEKVKVIGNESV